MPISPDQLDQLSKALPSMGRDPHSVRQRVEALEQLLERSFHIPGTKVPLGLDSIVGLIPVVGDLITAAMGAYIVWEGRNLGMSKFQLVRMTANVGIDTALGAIPFVGDAFDFIWRSNSKNLRIIKRHLDKHHPGTRTINV
ncbi:MAG: DUF4112 domain-containing protein [Sphingorhabdus sp.]|nr:DUF4112 domain-containing protein [Sphingorhabdus sp.]